jgi:hypothetical protein
VVWVAESFSEEHRAALSWLNDNTPETVGFFAVSPEVIRIAGSPPALEFRCVIAPNSFVKRVKRDDENIDASVSPLKEAFWKAFDGALAEDDVLSECLERYGGKLGFKWLIPNASSVYGEEPPHVLVWLKMPSSGRQSIGYAIHPARSAGSEVEELCDSAWAATEKRLRSTGDMATIRGRSELRSADFDSDDGVRATIHDILPRARMAHEELMRAIERVATKPQTGGVDE